MDRDFMRSFCQNYYFDFQTEAVKDSKEYQERRAQRYEIEKKFVLLLQESSKELVELFEVYLDSCTDELEILLQETYLMGAQDREKIAEQRSSES